MSDTPVTPGNDTGNDTADEQWLATIVAMDNATALTYLTATARATPATVADLAAAALVEVEQEPGLADQRIQLATALLRLLRSTEAGAGIAIPPAIDAQLAYANARLLVHRGQLDDAETELRLSQDYWRTANDIAGLTRTQLGLTQILAMQGRYAEAEIAARQAIASFATLPTVDTQIVAEDPAEHINVALPSAFSLLLLRAGAHHNLATLLLYMERHEAALAEYERALQLLSTVERTQLDANEERRWLSEVAHNELNRAGALTFLDEPALAEAALLRAAANFLQAADQADHARVQTNLGRLYLRSGHYADALAAFDRAVNDLLGDRAAELLVTPSIGITPENVAVEAVTGGGEQAEAAQSSVEALRQADELLLEQAMAYLVLNLLPETQQRLSHCEALFRTAPQPYELGQTLYTAGLLHLRANDLPVAAAQLAEAASLFTQLKNQFWHNRTTLAQAALAYAEGDPSGATATLDQLIAAIDEQGATEQPDDNGSAQLHWDLGGLAELYLLRMRLALVLAEVAELPKWADRVGQLLAIPFDELQQPAAALPIDGLASTPPAVERVPLPHYTQRFYHLLGQWRRAEGQQQQARHYFQRAIGLLENTRSLLPVEEIRTAFLDDKAELYADLILLLLEQADADPAAVADAFAAVERARSRALLERLLAAVGIDEASGIASDQAEAHEHPSDDEPAATALRSRLHWLYNQLMGESGNRRIDARLSAQLLAEEAALKQLEWRQSTLLQQAEPTDLYAFQAALAVDQQAIVYVILHGSLNSGRRAAVANGAADGREVMAFLVDRDSITPFRHLTSTTALTPLLDELRFQLGRAELGADFLQRHHHRLQQRLHHVLGDLYAQLIAPLRPMITASRLLIVPFGPLHRLPFHTLWNGRCYLLEELGISYAPSASTVVMRRRNGGNQLPNFSANQTRWAGIAVQDDAIPAARAEVTEAARCFTAAQLFLDGAAGRDSLTEAAQADVLHLATHGLFRPDNPFFSALKLADGWVNVQDLYRLPLRAQLVVLSACESGAGIVHGGDEVVGLVRGFLGAGAREVVASLWNVHDATAVKIMCQFYLALTNESGVLPADALRTAQRWAIREQLHPYYWAPFYVIGE